MSSRKRRAAPVVGVVEDKRKRKSPPTGLSDAHVAILKEIASPLPCAVRDFFDIETTNDNDDQQQFLQESSFPHYNEWGIWSILQDLGFVYRGGYRHDGLGLKGMDNQLDMAAYLLEHGIPEVANGVVLNEQQQEGLKIWIACTHVPPIQQAQVPRVLRETPLPSDYQALLWLQQLGFAVDLQTRRIYRIMAKDGQREEFASMEKLRVFVRGATNEVLLAGLKNASDETTPNPRKRARRTARKTKTELPLSEQEFMALRLWAATSPAPLPGETAIASKNTSEVYTDRTDEEPTTITAAVVPNTNNDNDNNDKNNNKMEVEEDSTSDEDDIDEEDDEDNNDRKQPPSTAEQQQQPTAPSADTSEPDQEMEMVEAATTPDDSTQQPTSPPSAEDEKSAISEPAIDREQPVGEIMAATNQPAATAPELSDTSSPVKEPTSNSQQVPSASEVAPSPSSTCVIL